MLHRIGTTGGPRRPGRGSIPALCCAVVIAVLAGCASGNSAPPNIGVTVNDVTESPRSVEGRVVTVSGEVNRIYGPHMFSIGGDDFLEGAELLVFGMSSLPSIVEQMDDTTELMNDIVQVTGMVRMFDEDAIEDDLDIDIDDDLFENMSDNRPVIIASEIDLTARTDVAPVAVVTPIPELEPVVVEPIVDEIIIVDAPDRVALAGRSVALIGVKVQTVVSDHAFWVGPAADRQLFVAIDEGENLHDDHMRIEPGQTVAVAGVLRKLPADLASVQSEWSLSAANVATLRGEMIYLDAQRTAILDSAGMTTASETTTR